MFYNGRANDKIYTPGSEINIDNGCNTINYYNWCPSGHLFF